MVTQVALFKSMKCTGKSKGSQGRLSYSVFEMHFDPGRLSSLPRGPLI